MTPQALKTLIESDATATAMLASRDYAGCAARCVTLAPQIHVETMLTERGVYKKLGATLGETIFQKLEGFAAASQPMSPIITRVLKWLEPTNGGLDFGDAQSLTLVAALTAGGLFTTEEQTAIVGMSLVSETITPSHVELAGLI